MTAARGSHTATLLPSGLVLIAGGYSDNGAPAFEAALLSSAELYVPALGTFTATGGMTVARASHSATLLGNGMVLIVGGDDGNGKALASAELYDPAAGTFAATGSMTMARYDHTATLLPSGMVLIAGGYTDNGAPAFQNALLSSAELYDPSAATFTATSSMTAARGSHTATLLPNGRVLIAGGYSDNGAPAFEATLLSSAELYVPALGTFTATGSMTVARASHSATLLGNGLVLIAGGLDLNLNLLMSAELYE
jgi:hypothetical protein